MGFNTKQNSPEKFGLRLINRYLPSPEDVELPEDIPGMHGSVDFSMMFGERIAKNRPLTYEYKLYEPDAIKRNFVKRQIENWLLRGTHEPLWDDSEPLYHYMAKATSVETSADEAKGVMSYTITFDAYPYKIKDTPEDDPYWDTKDITDYVQDTAFTISGSKAINLVNVGIIGSVPTIIASSAMTIQKGNKLFQITSGTTNSDRFRLEVGENPMTITGNGTISFSWYKEVK
ncbi:hypothetical protein [Carnobacterium pleistocenium]|uniref:hypothetical protein n=1 Tax=Carnobacterium pleistocenium TaxID=181073 RepID=UPI00068FF1C2|nr:hypothetical protein [Carnobacterium pleistocenium]